MENLEAEILFQDSAYDALDHLTKRFAGGSVNKGGLNFVPVELEGFRLRGNPHLPRVAVRAHFDRDRRRRESNGERAVVNPTSKP